MPRLGVETWPRYSEAEAEKIQDEARELGEFHKRDSAEHHYTVRLIIPPLS